MAQTAEVVIIGGGIIGASIAYHLRQDGLSGRLVVIERDTTYSRATTPMSMGGVRQQYAVPCNIALARYSLQFYEQFDEIMVGAWGRPQAHFHQCGYLFLFDETQRPAIMQKYEVQRQMGVEVELCSPQQVLEMFPHLGLHDITGATYGRRDGYLNPRGALQGFIERARELGCTWLQDEVVSFGRRFQSGEGWHSNENAVRFWNPSPRVPKEADARCYASATAYATLIRLCNVF